MHQLDRIEENVAKLVAAVIPHAADVLPRHDVRSSVDLLFRALLEDKKIEAIKMHRALTGYGLKESKDAVMNLCERLASREPAAEF